MPDVIIQFDDVYVDYHAPGQPPHRVLSGIDLKIESGEFVSIVGQTGCGSFARWLFVISNTWASVNRTAANIRINSRVECSSELRLLRLSFFSRRYCSWTKRSARLIRIRAAVCSASSRNCGVRPAPPS